MYRRIVCSTLQKNPLRSRFFSASPEAANWSRNGNPVEIFQEIKSKAVVGKPIGVAQLQHLLWSCKSAEHFSMAIEAAQFCQKQSIDFNERVATSLVDVSIQTKQINLLLPELTVYSNRIGSWISPKKLHALSEAITAEQLDKFIDTLNTVSGKGVFPQARTYVHILDLAATIEVLQERKRLTRRILTSAMRNFPEEEYLAMYNKYNIKSAPVAVAESDSTTSAVVE